MTNKLVDFSECPMILSNLDGATRKLSVLYKGSAFILKFAERIEESKRNPLMASFNNSPMSEWLGCHVMASLGIPVQETVLGLYKGHEVVGVKDFVYSRRNEIELVPFKNLEGNIISSSKRKKQPQLENMREVFNTHPALQQIKDEAWNRYWETFVADAMIGNFDRHGGNWGYLANREMGVIESLAPVYDCASSFTPRLSESAMAALCSKQDEMLQRAKSFPKACLLVNGEKVGYDELLLSDVGQPARNALMSLSDRISAMDFESILEMMPGVNDVRKQYYALMIESRIATLIQPAFDYESRNRGIQPHNLIEYRHLEPLAIEEFAKNPPPPIAFAPAKPIEIAEKASTLSSARPSRIHASNAKVERKPPY